MAKQSLQTRVKAFLTQDKNQRDKIQSLIVECREHGKQHNDWSVLSLLIIGLRNNKSRNIKAITAYIQDYTKGIVWQKSDKYEGYKVIKDQDVELLELTETWFEHKANQAAQQVFIDPMSRVKSLVTTLSNALRDGKIKEGEEEKAANTLRALQPLIAD